MGGMRDTPRTHAIGTDLYDIRPPAIRVAGLTKRFGDLTALAGVDLEVPAGSVLGLLGPNGAGKTTTVRILTTVIAADGGTAEVLGIDVARSPDAVRDRIGLAGQYAAVDENLTGRENLRLIARLTHLPRGQVAPGRTSCSTGSASPTPPTGPCARTPAGCDAGSTSPPRWCTGRRCCSSTSRRRVSTPSAGATCGRSSRTSPRTGRRSCSRPSTSRRRTVSRTTSS